MFCFKSSFLFWKNVTTLWCEELSDIVEIFRKKKKKKKEEYVIKKI
jgi:hypothetical protein